VLAVGKILESSRFILREDVKRKREVGGMGGEAFGAAG